jgi:hypothetical protein
MKRVTQSIKPFNKKNECWNVIIETLKVVTLSMLLMRRRVF